MTKLLQVFFLLICFTALQAQESKKVLFIGNSYTYTHNLPLVCRQLAEAAGHHLYTEMYAPGGNMLRNNFYEKTLKINSKDWDEVILQEQSYSSYMYNYEFRAGIEDLNSEIRKNHPCDNNTILFLTWGRKDPRQCGELCGFKESYTEMQEALTNAYINAGQENSCEVAPVGIAWQKVREDGDPVDLYSGDGSHQTYAGTYLAACVFYAVLYDESPVGNSFIGNLSSEDAAYLQEKANEAYEEYVALHYISSEEYTITVEDDYSLTWGHNGHPMINLDDQCRSKTNFRCDFNLSYTGRSKHAMVPVSCKLIQNDELIVEHELQADFPLGDCIQKTIPFQLDFSLDKIQTGSFYLQIDVDVESDVKPHNNQLLLALKKKAPEDYVCNDLREENTAYLQNFETIQNGTDIADWKTRGIMSALVYEGTEENPAYEGNYTGSVSYDIEEGALCTTCFHLAANCKYKIQYFFRNIAPAITSHQFLVNQGRFEESEKEMIVDFPRHSNREYQEVSKIISFDRDTVVSFTWHAYETSEFFGEVQIDNFSIENLGSRKTGGNCEDTQAIEITETVCESYTAVDGSVYTESGSYQFEHDEGLTCPTVYHLNLTVEEAQEVHLTEIACESYTAPDGAIYTQSGQYTSVIEDQFGCDLTCNIDLNVVHIVTSVHQNGNSLIADEMAEDATFQWINCEDGAFIEGANQRTYEVKNAGNYSVVIRKGNCLKQSACIAVYPLSISSQQKSSVLVYPNPYQENFFIELPLEFMGAHLQIYDRAGKIVHQQKIEQQKLNIDITIPKGMYFLRISRKEKEDEVIKMIKL